MKFSLFTGIKISNFYVSLLPMKGICYILFGIATFLFLPCVVVGQNVGEWQEPCDSSAHPIYSAAYTIQNQTTGWVAKMLRENQDIPMMYYEGGGYIEGQVINGAYPLLNPGRGYGKSKGNEFLNFYKIISDTPMIKPIDLVYNRKMLLVPILDKKNMYSGWVYGNLSFKEVKNQWIARLSKYKKIKWKRFNGFHILRSICGSGPMANFILGNHIYIYERICKFRKRGRFVEILFYSQRL